MRERSGSTSCTRDWEGRLLLYKQARHPVRSRVLDTLDFFRTGERMTKAEGE